MIDAEVAAHLERARPEKAGEHQVGEGDHVRDLSAAMWVTGGPLISGARFVQIICSTGFFGSSCQPAGGSGATPTTKTDSASSTRLVSWSAARADGSPTPANGTIAAG